jgi:large repetitive protein
MKRLRNSIGEAAVCRGRRKFLAALAFAALMLAVQSQSASADIFNSAVATAAYGGSAVSSAPSTASITVAPAAPQLTVTKTANDTTDVTAGQTITYSYVVSNTGNRTITGITLNDIHNGSGSAPAPANEILTTDAGTPGDSSDATANDGVWSVLAPGDAVTFTATYGVTQTDVDTRQ